MQNFNLIKCVFIFVAGIRDLDDNNDLAMNVRKPSVSMSMHLICLHSSLNLIFNESQHRKATSQKPQSVIDAITNFYSNENSNIHRGVHTLSQEATSAYEGVRKKVQKFINAKHNHEVILTCGTTAGINLVASSFGEKLVRKGDEILITAMEHHSNIVPWQILCERKGAKLVVVPISETGEIDIDDFKNLISPH